MPLYDELVGRAVGQTPPARPVPGPISRQPGAAKPPGSPPGPRGVGVAPPRPSRPMRPSNPAVVSAPPGRPTRPPMPFAGGAGPRLPIAPASGGAPYGGQPPPSSRSGPSSAWARRPEQTAPSGGPSAWAPQPPGQPAGFPTFQMDRVPSAAEMASLPEGTRIQTPYGEVDRSGRITPSPEGEVKYKEAVVMARKRLGPHPFAGDVNAPPFPVRLGRANINPFTGMWMRS